MARGRCVVARVREGEGLPVVFLHGLFSSSVTWDRLCSELGRPSVAFDLPGFGESDGHSHGVSRRAEDIAAAIRTLGLERFELVGHSFGGAVAACVASLVPTRVASLTLVAAAGFGPLRRALHLGVGYRGPVTAVLGTRDRIVRQSHGRGVLRALPQAEVLLWEGGHSLQAERQDALIALISAGRIPADSLRLTVRRRVYATRQPSSPSSTVAMP